MIIFILVSPYFKQKLVGLYTNALADAKNEVGYVQSANVVCSFIMNDL